MRRKLTFWRVCAIAVAVIAVVSLGAVLVPGGGLIDRGEHISRIKIQGLIRGNLDRVQALEKLGKSSTRAVIVRVNSPGGTTAGSEELFDALRALQAKKPMVVVIDGLAASGGYMVAIAADHIVAQDTALVGSIGVLFQYPNFHQALETLGIKVEAIKSSPLKAEPSAFRPTSEEARAAIESVVLDSYAWFRNLVKSRRNLDDAQLATVADGRVFTGRQAVELKLIDGLGNEKAALAWLEKVKNVPANLPVRDYALEPRFSELSFLRLAAWAFEAVGLSDFAQRIEKWGAVQAIERLNLDGLLALWHPPLSN